MRGGAHGDDCGAPLIESFVEGFDHQPVPSSSSLRLHIAFHSRSRVQILVRPVVVVLIVKERAEDHRPVAGVEKKHIGGMNVVQQAGDVSIKTLEGRHLSSSDGWSGTSCR